MAEKPILFSAPMVRALLAGKKTQTRRLVKPSNMVSGGAIKLGFHLLDFDRAANENGSYLKVPFAHPVNGWESAPEDDTRGRIGSRIQVGDLLWVKEGWRTTHGYDSYAPSMIGGAAPVQYKDLLSEGGGMTDWGRWRSSLHMPRWASRITLKVTRVRCQRLHDITESDAKAEGVEPWHTAWTGCPHVESFEELWDSINGKTPGASWADNPWVFAYELEVVK